MMNRHRHLIAAFVCLQTGKKNYNLAALDSFFQARWKCVGRGSSFILAI